LNCSILDGWWVEGYAPDLGWAIGRGETYADPNVQDQVESMALYDLLEKQIIPTFYDRGVDGTPREWISRMKNCMRRLAPVFNTNRMVRNYTEMFYILALDRGRLLVGDSMKRAIELAHAKDKLRHMWSGIRIVGVHTSGNGHFKVGDSMQVEALVDMPSIGPAEVAVQLYAGPISGKGEIEQPQAIGMSHAKAMGADRHLFVGKIECRTSGRQGFAVRILPGATDLATPYEPGLITWN
jgi:starch phosphorylase